MIGKPKGILIAEDNPITRKSLYALLKKAGHDVRIAEDGAKAFELVQQQPPQIVVTDWNMPRMSGLELCRSIRRLYAPHELYLLVATARDSREDTLDAMQAGADDFLTKPIDPTELLTRISQAEIAQDRFRSQAALAESDPLTGLKNRRVFWDIVERGIARANRYNLQLTAIVLDIDFFKHINDNIGHAAGDEVLCHVARMLQENLRSTDCLARIGGDEFALLLPSTPLESALVLIERIRLHISECEIPQLGQESQLTITAGVAAYASGVSTAEQLINHADQALLEAKRAGRNRAVAFDAVHQSMSEQTDTSKLLEDLVAVDVMTEPIVCLRQNDPLYRVVDLFLQLRIDSAPVVNDDGELVGVIAEKDLLSNALKGANWSDSIKDIVNTSVITFQEHVSVLDICEALQRSNFRRAIIVRDTIPVGIVTQVTVLRLLGYLGGGGVTYRSEAPQFLARENKPCLVSIADAITQDMMQLKRDASTSRRELTLALVASATRLEEQAQELLALSQNHIYRLQPD